MKLPSPLHSNLWTLLLIFYSTHNGGRYMTKLTQVPTLMLALIRNLIVVILHTRLNIPSVSAWWATLPPAIAAKLSELKIWSVFFLHTTLQDLATSREGEKKKKKALVFKCLLRPAPTCLSSCLFYLPLVYPHKICCYSMNMAYKVSFF